NRMKCTNNLKLIGLCLHSYCDMFEQFPRATVPNPELPPEDRLSWYAAVVPFLEKDPDVRHIDTKRPWTAAENRQAREAIKVTFPGPTGQEAGPAPQNTASYVGITGVGEGAAALSFESDQAGFFGYERDLKRHNVNEGLSNIAVALETTRQNGPWIAGGPTT